MPTFRILIDTDNAAFAAPDGNYDPFAEGEELSRILRDLADRMIDNADVDHTLRDSNGNVVGRAQFVDHP